MASKSRRLVARVEVSREELSEEAREVLRDLYRLETLPLAPALILVELQGVSTAVVNAIRRAAMDEMPGVALDVPVDGFDTALTTDEFAIPQFVNQRIELIPLRPRIPPETVQGLRLRLDVTNHEAVVRTVYAGDLQVAAGALAAPLFNPTFELAFLHPGRRLVVENIALKVGYGRDHAKYNVARRGAYTHLDLEQHTDDEMRRKPGEEGQKRPGGAVPDLSGYKLSCLVANPRHHLLRLTAPAVTADREEALSIVAGACANLEERLRLIVSTVERRAEADTLEGNSTYRGMQYTVARLGGGLYEAQLLIPGETTSIGEVVCRAVNDLTPDAANIVNRLVDYENRLSITLRHREDVTQVLLAALRHAMATFAAIRGELA